VSTSVSFHILCFSLISLRIFLNLNRNINVIFENGRWPGLVQCSGALTKQGREDERKGKEY
jgi:hypothetical protein